MASVMGMNRYFANEGIKGLGEAAEQQTIRENAKTQLEAAHDATVKATTASTAASGAMIGATAGATGTSWSGPGMIAGAAVGALAGWLFSEFG